MFYDDLPIWGFIGKTEKIMRPGEKPALRFYLFTHIHFDIHYHENRVIEVNVSTDPARTVDITGGEKIIVDYTYSVSWRETPTTFDKRMEKYSRYSFLPQHLEVSLPPLIADQNAPLISCAAPWAVGAPACLQWSCLEHRPCPLPSCD